MNLDTVITFFSFLLTLCKKFISKELIRKVICVGKCDEIFQAGSTCTFFYKLHTQYGKKSMCWLNIFISSSYPQGQDNRRIKTHIFLKSGFKILPANLLNVHVYKYSFFPKQLTYVHTGSGQGWTVAAPPWKPVWHYYPSGSSSGKLQHVYTQTCRKF